MIQRDALIALRESVVEATGADRELDEAIHAALLPSDPWWQAIMEGRRLVSEGRPYEKLDRCNCNLMADSWAHSSRVDHYTGSLDAADRLVCRVLPQWKLGTAASDPTRYKGIDTAWAKVEPYLRNDEGWSVGAFDARLRTVPLSICAAVITAKIALLAQETSHD